MCCDLKHLLLLAPLYCDISLSVSIHLEFFGAVAHHFSERNGGKWAPNKVSHTIHLFIRSFVSQYTAAAIELYTT